MLLCTVNDAIHSRAYWNIVVIDGAGQQRALSSSEARPLPVQGETGDRLEGLLNQGSQRITGPSVLVGDIGPASVQQPKGTEKKIKIINLNPWLGRTSTTFLFCLSCSACHSSCHSSTPTRAATVHSGSIPESAAASNAPATTVAICALSLTILVPATFTSTLPNPWPSVYF